MGPSDKCCMANNRSPEREDREVPRLALACVQGWLRLPSSSKERKEAVKI
jgi:hypothetical protein